MASFSSDATLYGRETAAGAGEPVGADEDEVGEELEAMTSDDEEEGQNSFEVAAAGDGFHNPGGEEGRSISVGDRGVSEQ